jgi:F-type H+-transporting ATPase subunit gamma
MQITSAMKMVSAAKAKESTKITAMRPYAEKLTELLQNLRLLKEMWEGVYNTT